MRSVSQRRPLPTTPPNKRTIVYKKKEIPSRPVSVCAIRLHLLLATQRQRAAFSFLASSSLTSRPWISRATSSPSAWIRSWSRPMSDTYTPLERSGYEPTRTPASLTRACSVVRYGAIEDSGRLRGHIHKGKIIEGEDAQYVLGENLLAARPLARRGQGQERHEPVEHALEEPRDAREDTQLAL